MYAVLFFLLLFFNPAAALEVDSDYVYLPATTGYTAETWVQINFGTTFSEVPIVITTPGPSTGGNPFTIRIRNIKW